MAADGVNTMEAIREQLQEQELALLEIEAALQHDEDAEVMQVLSQQSNCSCWESGIACIRLPDGVPSIVFNINVPPGHFNNMIRWTLKALTCRVYRQMHDAVQKRCKGGGCPASPGQVTAHRSSSVTRVSTHAADITARF